MQTKTLTLASHLVPFSSLLATCHKEEAGSGTSASKVKRLWPSPSSKESGWREDIPHLDTKREMEMK
jgi:hypothetical protein